ncbi:MAG: hypothetical protein ACE5JR_08460 [Gemmatimonadota bacterium]
MNDDEKPHGSMKSASLHLQRPFIHAPRSWAGNGGLGAVLYNVVTRRRLEPVGNEERHHGRHRHHRLALAAPFLAFPILYPFARNPIFSGIAALLVGAARVSAGLRPPWRETIFVRE